MTKTRNLADLGGGFIQAGTGAVQRTVESKLQDVVSVKDFGAVGDGVTDDTSAIQDTLNTGKNVFIPNGTYLINALTSLLPVSNQSIILEENATLQAATNSSDIYFVIKLDGVQNVSISGGKIIGDRTTHTGITGESGMGIGMYNSDHITVRDIIISDCWGDGIYVGGNAGQECENVRIENVVCRNNRRQGVSVVAAKNVVIEGSLFTLSNGVSPQYGIDLESNPGTVVQNVAISNCTCSSNAGAGLGITATGVENVRVTNSTFTSNTESGISLGYPKEQVVITGCTVSGNTLHGIEVYGDNAYVTFNHTITNNIIELNGKDGIHVERNVSNVIISGNNVFSNANNGIVLDGLTGYPVDGCTVSNNILLGNGTATANTYSNIVSRLYSRNHVITGNSCYAKTYSKYGIEITAVEQFVIDNNDVTSGGVTAPKSIAATNFQGGNNTWQGTVAPSTGTWETGSIVFDKVPDLYAGWICTSGGSPGTWQQFGNVFEAGTWIPSIQGSTAAGVGTYTDQLGKYTRVGNRILFWCYVNWTAHTGTGNLRVTGLPFTSQGGNSLYVDPVCVHAANITLTANSYALARVASGTNRLDLLDTVVGGGGLNLVAMDAAGTLILSGHYNI